MANGELGKSMSSASQNVTVYEVPDNVAYAHIGVSMVNIGVTETKVRLAVSYTDAPGNVDFLEYDAVLEANGGVLERTCIITSPGEKVVVYADSSNVAVRVSGLEETE